MPHATLLVNMASTWAMVGLIWFVQIVHYPLFARVGRDVFATYEQDHQRLTTYVVLPLMLSELATAILLWWWRPPQVSLWQVVLGMILVGLIWGLTFLVQVPQHTALSAGFDVRTQERLVAGNWWRTAAWTARGMLVLWMVRESMFRP